MARPTKVGLDYFPFDVDFGTDEKVEAIMGEFGAKGTLVFIYLLSAIYRNGYYLQWTELTKNSLANRVGGASGELVGLVVKRLVEYGTFDKDLFVSDNVLTSQRIQDTYLEATKRRKSQKPTEYWINADINDSSNPVNVDINPKSKPKESKVNQTEKNPKKKTVSKTRDRVYAHDSSAYKLSVYLWKKIKANNPDAKPITEADLQRWSNDARKILELDKRDRQLTREVIDWCQASDFWHSNILSVKKLREQFDQLLVKMRDDQHPKPGRQQIAQVETLPDWAKNGYQSPERGISDAEKATRDASIAALKKLRKEKGVANA